MQTYSTAPIAYTATNADVFAALNAVPPLSGAVGSVTGTSTSRTVTFTSAAIKANGSFSSERSNGDALDFVIVRGFAERAYGSISG